MKHHERLQVLPPLRRRHSSWILRAFVAVAVAFFVINVTIHSQLEQHPLDKDGVGVGRTAKKEASPAAATAQVFDSALNPSDYSNVFCRRKQSSRQQQQQHPILLWGIPSTASETEVARRQLLRSTYLNYYREFGENDNDTNNINNTTIIPSTKDRICSLQEWTCHPDRFRNACQLIFVFFMGGNPQGPPILLHEAKKKDYDFRSMLMSPPTHVAHNVSEPGAVYLNIRENQFDGKMTTWFEFARRLGHEYPEIDFVAKVDSDLLLFTPNFMDFVNDTYQELAGWQKAKAKQHRGSTVSSSQRRIVRTYGGVEFPATNCLVNETFDHPCPLPLAGPSYMSGELNFMSMDLAAYIVSEDCPRDEWTIPHEDVSLSNYVYSFQNNTRYHEKQHLAQDEDTTIDIVSVNTSRILLTTSTTAAWSKLNLHTNPEAYSYLLWGHSIKRGDHKRFLVWKKDRTFKMFWEKFLRHKQLYSGNNSNKTRRVNAFREELLQKIRQKHTQAR